MATQEQVNSCIDALITNGVTPENLAMLMQRAEASLNVSRAALAILAHDAATAALSDQRAAARADLVAAMEAAQAAFVTLGE